MKPSMEEIKALFDIADIDKSGKLSSKEVKRILELNSNQQLSEKSVEEFMKKYDLNGDKEWDIDELVKMFSC
uniref:Calcium-binding EF-hand,domain-containing protein n=1 Tax=Schistosoma japonicum TaxID=6182 RepID=C1LYM5_SCHJA|nr:Calcium-binding EF-hand,domain-containing protein [Schistosoma japonicum]